jgi:cyclohexa-1,5-dienecarbonyl-CoA hydratase
MPRVAFAAETHAYRITLDAPPLHILDLPMLEELRDALARVTADRHALILDSTADAFSAGVSVPDHLGDRAAAMLSLFHECFRILARLDLVTVAVVRGLALGGGCELALACDFVLASDRAQFGLPEIKLGVFPPVAAWQLSRQLPRRKGLELILTGDAITATEAERLGLVNRAFRHDDLDREADEWLQRIYRHSASSLRVARKAFRLAEAGGFEAALERTERLYLEELMATEDATEGLAAFVEKRKPVWRGE